MHKILSKNLNYSVRRTLPPYFFYLTIRGGIAAALTFDSAESRERTTRDIRDFASKSQIGLPQELDRSFLFFPLGVQTISKLSLEADFRNIRKNVIVFPCAQLLVARSHVYFGLWYCYNQNSPSYLGHSHRYKTSLKLTSGSISQD